MPSIYISYAWGSESEAIAEAIEKEFQKRGLRIIRDKNDLGYKGRIKTFMEEIGRGKYIILIISNKYLRSENCMFELLQIFRNRDFYERIFPVVLEEVKIAKAVDRLDLLKYWENETENLNAKIRELKELSNIQGVTDDLNLYTEIRGNIARLTHILKDINTLTTDRHIQSDFEQLYELVEEKVKLDLLHNKSNEGDAIADQLPELPVGTGAEEPTKERSKTIKRMALLVAVLVIGVVTFQVINTSEPINGMENALDTILVNEHKIDSPQHLKKDSSEPDSKKDEVINEKEKTAVADKSYTVKLMVPSNMVQANVLVDGEKAEIISRGLVSITVKIKKKTMSHHFEINDGLDKCTTDKLITKDNTQIPLCH